MKPASAGANVPVHLFYTQSAKLVCPQSGSVEKSEEGPAKIKVKNISLLEDIVNEIRKTVKINIQCDVFKKEDLKRLRDVLVGLNGKASVILEFRMNGEKQIVKLNEIKIDHTKVDVLFKHFSKGLEVEVDEILS
mgnify:CR=1 FL=1